MIRGVGSSRPTTPSSAGGVFFGGPTYNRNFSVNGYSSPQYSSPQHFGGENDHLHVVIQCDDTPNRAEIRINTALSLIDALFAPVVSLELDYNIFLLGRILRHVETEAVVGIVYLARYVQAFVFASTAPRKRLLRLFYYLLELFLIIVLSNE